MRPILRYLTGLNVADWEEELRNVGISRPDPQIVGALSNYAVIKARGYSREEISQITSDLMPEITLLEFMGEDAPEAALLAGNPQDLKRFRDPVFPDMAPISEDFFLRMRELVENVFSHHRWEYTIPGGKLILEEGKPLIMGILNVTPDSFSDGGKFLDAGRAVEHGRKMLEAGADVLDIGGESTRPGAPEVPAEEEWRRIAPVLKELLKIEGCVVSVDTTKSEVAEQALEAGAHIINDISGMTFDPRMREVVARYGVPVILMHIKGTPRTMQKNPHYHLLLEEVTDFLHQRCREAHEQGIDQIIVDPGIGFGKRPEDNLELIRRLGELKALGYPILLGPSRKSFIGHVLDRPVEERLIGTLTSVVYGIMEGAHIVRVHDVEETHQAVKLVRAIREGKALST